MAPTVKKSKTWEFFKDLGEYKAKCTICMKILSHKGAGPYNLTRHLKSAHPLVLAGIQEDRTAINNDISVATPLSPATPSTSQAQGESSSACTDGSTQFIPVIPVPNSRPLDFNKNNQINQYFAKPLSLKKSETLNKLLLLMIVKNYLPFTIVESDSFRAFIKELCPSYVVPSRKTLSKVLLQKFYNIVREDVTKLLGQAEYIALTTDAWTSASHNQYVAVTAHFVENNNIKAVMLGCIPDAQRHTAQNLADLIKKICTEWNVMEKVVSVTADNANNIQAAISLLKLKQVPCFAHTLNLIVQAGLSEIKVTQMKVKTIVELFKVKTIVELFQRSVLASERLTAMQKQLGDKQLTVKQDVITRWNSTFDMFERILDIKRSVISTIATDYPNTPNLTPDDIEILSKCCDLLRPFKSVTEIMSAEKHVTVSQIIVLANLLKKKCEAFTKDSNIPQTVMQMAMRFATDISTRFRNVEDHKLFAVSTLVDPRFKAYGFPDEKKSSVDNAKKYLTNIAAKSITSVNETDAEISENISESDQNIQKPSIWDEFDLKVVAAIKKQNPTSAAIIEVDKYFDEPLISRKNHDPIMWWYTKRHTYPRLYDVVKKHLCTPATSTPSERVFSKAGHVVTDRRNRLHGKKVRMIFARKYVIVYSIRIFLTFYPLISINTLIFLFALCVLFTLQLISYNFLFTI